MKATNEIEIKLQEYLNKNLEKETNFFKIINKRFKQGLFQSSNEEKEIYEEKNNTIGTSFELSKRKEYYSKEESISPINSYLNEQLDKNNFQTTLFNFIDKTGKKDSDIYNKAYIDRRLFSKIRNDANYHPSKNTVISLGLALNLNINDFEKLLNSAAYSLPKNNYFDLIIRFCIEEKIYNIIEINNYLYKYNCNPIN